MIHFGTSDDLRWMASRGVVRLVGVQDGRRIVCEVSVAALGDNLRASQEGEDYLDIAKRNFDALTDQFGSLIARRCRFEADGSILLRSLDWR